MPGVNLASDSHFSAPQPFSSTGLNLSPGTYLIVLWDSAYGGNWEMVSADYYSNPILVKVVASTLGPDPYEPDNTEATAYNFPLTFTNNKAYIATTGSNINTNTDVDFYKIELATGYDYTIKANIDDLNHSSNGENYTCNTTFFIYYTKP